ncbi:MAG: hypothetical protein KDB23_07130 [Planctomycetales bacterium]|nr:hypothetical protein [Planctomycetales bacterium]
MKKVCSLSVCASLLVTLVAATCSAHPGHGSTAANQVEHYVAEPLHAAPLLATLAVVAALLAGTAAWRRFAR